MNKEKLKELSENVVKGNFQDSFIKIEQNEVTLNTESAIKLVVACCHVCNAHSTSPEKINDEELVEFTIICSKSIKDPTSFQLESYLKSAFHILKFLLDKRSYNCVLGLKNFLLPNFIPDDLSQNQKKIYINISCTIYNKTVVIFSRTHDPQNENLAIQFSNLIAEMQRRFCGLSLFLETAKKCITTFICLKCDSHIIANYYLSNLNSIEVNTSALPEEYVISLITLFELIYSHMLKKQDFQLAETCYQKTAEYFKNFSQEIIDILENCKYLNPIYDEPKFKVVNWNTISQPLLVTTLASLISTVAFAVQQYYTSSNKTIDKITKDIQNDLCEFLHKTSNILYKTELDCNCNEKCEIKTNFAASLKLLYSIIGLAKYKLDIMTYIERYLQRVVYTKNKNCAKWEKYWCDIGGQLYYTGIQLCKAGDDIAGLYLKTMIKFLLIYEGVNPTIINKSYLLSALNSIADNFLAQKKIKRSLLFTSFSLALSQEPLKNDLIRWSKIKNSNRDCTDIQDLTSVKILSSYKNEIEAYCPYFFETVLTREAEIKLLIIELKNYKTYWKSKLPMMATYKELFSKADAWTLSTVLIDIWGQVDIHVHDNLPNLIKKTITRFESEIKTKDDRFYVTLSYLYFLQHKYQVKITVSKHCEEMNKTLQGIEKPENNAKLDADDECDVISSYDCLKLENYLKMIRGLEKSLEILSEVMKKWKTCSADVDKKILFNLLSNIGHEYSLHGHNVKSLRAWQFALTIAEAAGNKLHILQAITFIMELVDGGKTSVKTFIDKGDEIIENLDEKESFDVILYYLCKAEAFFFVDVTRSHEAFKMAQDMIAVFSKENDILKAKLHLLHHRYLTLPCHLKLEDHREFTLVRIYQAHHCAFKHYSETFVDSAYDMRIFFEVNEALIKMHHDTRSPREVRCYGKEILLVAQKLVLSLRSANVLFYLTHADAMSCKFDDCRVKILGLADILGLDKVRTPLKQTVVSPKQNKLELDVQELQFDFNEMVLDLPKQKVSTRQLSPGSPSFQVETFKIPHSLKHKDSCDCFYCTSLEFQDFVLKKNFLQGFLNVYEKHDHVAKDFFCGTLKLHEYLKNRAKCYQEKIEAYLSKDLVPEMHDKFLEIYALTLLQYSNLFVSNGNVIQAEHILDKLLKALEPRYLRHTALYCEALVHSLDIVAIQAESMVKNNNEVTEFDNSNNQAGSEEVKTPEGKRNQVTVQIEIPSSPTFDEPKRRPRRVKFEIPQDEEAGKQTMEAASTSIKQDLFEHLKKSERTPISNGACKTSKSKVKTDLAQKNKLLKNSSKTKPVPQVIVSDENGEVIGTVSATGENRQPRTLRKKLTQQQDETERKRSKRNMSKSSDCSGRDTRNISTFVNSWTL